VRCVKDKTVRCVKDKTVRCVETLPHGYAFTYVTAWLRLYLRLPHAYAIINVYRMLTLLLMFTAWLRCY